MAAGHAVVIDYWCLFMLPIAETPDPQSSVGPCQAALLYRFPPSLAAGCPLHPVGRTSTSIQKQSCFGILYYPFQPFLQIQTCHRAARHDVPFVCLDGLESQSLQPLDKIGPTTTHHPGRRSPTSRTSSSVMAPGTSLLFLKTRRLAPERRSSMVSSCWDG